MSPSCRRHSGERCTSRYTATRCSVEVQVRGENVRAYERCFTHPDPSSGLCVNCGIPIDSQRFDESSIATVPEVGDEIVLASFDLPAQYCGSLEHVSQFTDLNMRRPDQVDTVGLEW